MRDKALFWPVKTWASPMGGKTPGTAVRSDIAARRIMIGLERCPEHVLIIWMSVWADALVSCLQSRLGPMCPATLGARRASEQGADPFHPAGQPKASLSSLIRRLRDCMPTAAHRKVLSMKASNA